MLGWHRHDMPTFLNRIAQNSQMRQLQAPLDTDTYSTSAFVPTIQGYNDLRKLAKQIFLFIIFLIQLNWPTTKVVRVLSIVFIQNDSFLLGGGSLTKRFLVTLLILCGPVNLDLLQRLWCHAPLNLKYAKVLYSRRLLETSATVHNPVQSPAFTETCFCLHMLILALSPLTILPHIRTIMFCASSSFKCICDPLWEKVPFGRI